MTQHSLLDINPFPVWICDCNLIVVAINNAVLSTFGFPKEQWLEKSILDYFPAVSFDGIAPDMGIFLDESNNTRFRLQLNRVCFEGNVCVSVAALPDAFFKETVGVVHARQHERRKASRAVFSQDIPYTANISEGVEISAAYESLIHSLNIGVIILDPQGDIIVANRKVHDFFAIKEYTLLGLSAVNATWDLIDEHGIKIPEDELPFRKVLRSRKPVKNLTVGVHHNSDQDYNYLLLDAVPSFREDGSIQLVTITFTDNTYRVVSEKALKASQRIIARESAAVKLGIWEWDVATDKLVWDDNMLSIFGLDRDSFGGSLEDYKNCIHPDDLAQVLSAVEHCFKNRIAFHAVYRIVRPVDQQERYISGQGSLIFDQDDRPCKMLGINWDVTHQVAREDDLQLVSEHLSIAKTAANLGMWEYYPKSNRVKWDDVNKRIFGVMDEGPLTIERWLQTIHPGDRDKQFKYLGKLLESGDTYDTEYRIVMPQGGAVRYIRALANVKRNTRNEVTHMVGVNWDITEQKSYEENIRISEARYRSIVDHQTDMICRFDEAGRLTFFNKAFLDFFAHGNNGTQVTEFVDLFRSADQEKIRSHIQTLFAGKTNGDPVEYLIANGNDRRWVQWIYTPLGDLSGHVVEVQAIGQDITERKLLEEQSAKLDKIVRQSFNEIYLFNEHTLRFEFANDAALHNLGYSAHELVRMRITDLFHYPNEMALQILLRTLRTGETDRLQLQMRHRRKDGSHYDIQTLIQQLGDDRSFVAIATDITDKLETERRLLATIREKEALIKEIHHRVKNNLQLISSIIYIKSASVDNKDVRYFLNDMRQKIHSVGLVHERLLQSENLDQVEISDYLGKILSALQSSHRRDDLRITIRKNIVNVYFDIDTAIYCALLLNELVINSIKHAFTSATEGIIDVSLQPDDSQYVLSVKDNGLTMPGEINPGDSQSFGMNLLDIFVRQLGGTIEVIRNQGTEFRVMFNLKKSKP